MALILLVTACGGGSSATPEPSPEASATTAPAASDATAVPTVVASTGAEADAALQPGPQPGTACPVALGICQFAVDMESVIKTGNVDGFFMHATPVQVACSGEATTAGVSLAVCQGAAANEVRQGYWALQGGTGLVVSEAELREGLSRWFDAASRAGGSSDVYGPGAVRIGSLSCTRRPDQASGTCIGNSIQVHFTFINPENVQGTGATGERVTFHVSASVVDGVASANGLGTVSPPNRVLAANRLDIQDAQGNPLVLEVYPWTH